MLSQPQFCLRLEWGERGERAWPPRTSSESTPGLAGKMYWVDMRTIRFSGGLHVHPQDLLKVVLPVYAAIFSVIRVVVELNLRAASHAEWQVAAGCTLLI